MNFINYSEHCNISKNWVHLTVNDILQFFFFGQTEINNKIVITYAKMHISKCLPLGILEVFYNLLDNGFMSMYICKEPNGGNKVI